MKQGILTGPTLTHAHTNIPCTNEYTLTNISLTNAGMHTHTQAHTYTHARMHKHTDRHANCFALQNRKRDNCPVFMSQLVASHARSNQHHSDTWHASHSLFPSPCYTHTPWNMRRFIKGEWVESLALQQHETRWVDDQFWKDGIDL